MSETGKQLDDMNPDPLPASAAVPFTPEQIRLATIHALRLRGCGMNAKALVIRDRWFKDRQAALAALAARHARLVENRRDLAKLLRIARNRAMWPSASSAEIEARDEWRKQTDDALRSALESP